jgi:hypothetical protein
MLLAFAAAACLAGVLFSLLLGYLGATDETSSSWSDPGPRHMLQQAIAFGVAGAICVIGGIVARRRA